MTHKFGALLHHTSLYGIKFSQSSTLVLCQYSVFYVVGKVKGNENDEVSSSS